MKITFKIKFNDFGSVYVIAEDYKDAERKFLDSGYGGEKPNIKSIVAMNESCEPLS